MTTPRSNPSHASADLSDAQRNLPCGVNSTAAVHQGPVPLGQRRLFHSQIAERVASQRLGEARGDGEPPRAHKTHPSAKALVRRMADPLEVELTPAQKPWSL